MLGITGTDGKTSTTDLTVAILRAAGHDTEALGNTDVPLLDAIDDDRYDVFVVECTSFRLAFTERFRCDAAVWLNLAPDHLNWHDSMDSYAAAKARIWAAQRADDAAIAFTGAPAVLEHLAGAPGRHLTFGPGGDYRAVDDVLVGPAGEFGSTSAMRRSLPHDVTNALAASALVLESGLADGAAIRTALADFTGPPHRLELLGSDRGVEWYNDSKATTPHAAAVAIHAFDDIVLIAGGKDKHVDLAEMAVEADRVKAVIAIGETRDAVAAAFAGVATVETTEFLPAAVERAAALARPGDTVLLSPGCASLDQYRSFEARGDHFRDLAPIPGGSR
jgi:UDP-N-acetylmuramoylalanine--D-glutamate ligase